MTIPLPTMRTTRFFFCFLLMTAAWSLNIAAPNTGKIFSLKLDDVDGRTLSTADGVVTVLVLTTRANLDKAREVGDRVPERCLGNPKYRMVSIIQFGNRTRMMQYLLSASVRHRLDSEAIRVQARYKAKGLSGDARTDIHAVADFNGQTAAQLGLQPAPEFDVLILSGDGKLVHEWTTVPSSEELAAAIP